MAHRIVLALVSMTLIAFLIFPPRQVGGRWTEWYGYRDYTRLIVESAFVLIVGGFVFAMIPWRKRQD